MITALALIGAGACFKAIAGLLGWCIRDLDRKMGR